jgi:hypothetical protein
MGFGGAPQFSEAWKFFHATSPIIVHILIWETKRQKKLFDAKETITLWLQMKIYKINFFPGDYSDF